LPLFDSSQRSLEDAIAREGVVALSLDAANAAAITILPRSARGKIVLWAPLSTDPASLDIARHVAVGALLMTSAAPEEEILAAAVARLRDSHGMSLRAGRLASNSPIASLELVESARRGEVLDAIESYFKPHGMEVRLLNHLLSSADELITNALYHAPLDGMGSRVFAHRSKIDPVTMPIGHPITVAWGYDGHHALVSVRDTYGSLDRSTLIGALPGVAHADRTVSSSGLGLRSALRGASTLAFHIVPDHFTECIAIVATEGGYRHFAQRGKTLEVYF
jgi:hypothetical protein